MKRYILTGWRLVVGVFQLPFVYPRLWGQVTYSIRFSPEVDKKTLPQGMVYRRGRQKHYLLWRRNEIPGGITKS